MIRAVVPVGLLAALLAVPGTASARSVSAAGHASASIIEPLRAVPLEDLSFGTLTVGAADGGEVHISAAGSSASYTGSAAPACGPSSECNPHPARFAVSGEANRAYRVQLPSQLLARGTNTGRLLDVSGFSIRTQSQASAGGRGLLDRDGEDLFTVGGVLTVPPQTPADTFRAELSVSVFYE